MVLPCAPWRASPADPDPRHTAEPYYLKAHLPGAILIPDGEADRLAPTLLPEKLAAIVTYCANTACANSRHVASALERLGYSDVRSYEAGKQDWIAAGLPVEIDSAGQGAA
jgi:rhodanese-related sulfurtransferase